MNSADINTKSKSISNRNRSGNRNSPILNNNKALISALLLASMVSGCYVAPSAKDDFAQLPDDPLTRPIRKYVRSWDSQPRVDIISKELQAMFSGSSINEFTRYVFMHHGTCDLSVDSSTMNCAAEFAWNTSSEQVSSQPSHGKNRVCLNYTLEHAQGKILSIVTKATCFETTGERK